MVTVLASGVVIKSVYFNEYQKKVRLPIVNIFSLVVFELPLVETLCSLPCVHSSTRNECI